MSSTLGISREHVYYRSPRPRVVTATARLLWYVSGARKSSGVAAVVASSRLEEVIAARPGELHQRFRHLGVWKQSQVTDVAKHGMALALRFADTEVFPHRVTLRRLRDLEREFGQPLSLRSRRPFSPPSTRRDFPGMSQSDRALLLSIRPRYAHAILNGTKTAEIRRQRPNVHPGTLVIIYATKPVGALIGTARISDVSEGAPVTLWERHRRATGVSQAEYDGYLSGTDTAYLLFLCQVQRLEPLLTLEQMRLTNAFQPPQSYRYLSQRMLHSLVDGHPAGRSLLAKL